MDVTAHICTCSQVVRMVVGNTAAGPLYGHLIPLVFLLVDGNYFTLLTY